MIKRSGLSALCCVVLVLAASCTSTSDGDAVAASLEEELCDVSSTEAVPACRRVSASNPDPVFSSEVLPTGEEVSCFVPTGGGEEEYDVRDEIDAQRIVTDFAEFDPSKMVHVPEGPWWTAPSRDTTVFVDDFGGYLHQPTSGRYLASLVGQWVREVYEPSVDYPGVWLAIRPCGVSPYPQLKEFLERQGLPTDLSAAGEVLLDLHGGGSNVEATTAAFQAWIDETQEPPALPTPDWVDRDPRFRSFDDVPEEMESELIEVDFGIRVPPEWRQSPTILCLRSPSGWSGCIETTAVTDEDYEAEGIPLSGYTFPGEDVTIALVPGARLFDRTSNNELVPAPIKELGTVRSDDLKASNLSVQLSTDATPETLIADSTAGFAFTIERNE